MKKYISILLVLLTFVFVITGCSNNNKDNISNNSELEESKIENLETENSKNMCLVLESSNAKPGEDTIVYVKTKNDPGFLTMAVEIHYDMNAMSLINVETGNNYQNYNFVAPKNLKSGCIASWFIPSLVDNSSDGELLKLHFHIFDETESGEYQISIIPLNDDGIVDSNYEPIEILECSDVIKVNN